MNQKTFKLYKQQQEMQETQIDLQKNIKDLEIELEYVEIRRPHDLKYIRQLESKIDELYQKLEDEK
jgi:cell division protein FtsB